MHQAAAYVGFQTQGQCGQPFLLAVRVPEDCSTFSGEWVCAHVPAVSSLDLTGNGRFDQEDLAFLAG